MEEGKTVAVLMIDQSAAFDVCNHTILEAKLELEEEQNSTAQWFHSYLSDRSQCSKVEGKVSSVLNIPACSVIQGGCRSGLLYTILTCDLPDIIHQHIIKEPARYCVEDGDMATFVDDSTNYYGNKDPKIVREVTQKNFNSIEDYMTSNKHKSYGDKSHLLVLTKGEGQGGGVAAARRREAVTLQAGGNNLALTE